MGLYFLHFTRFFVLYDNLTGMKEKFRLLALLFDELDLRRLLVVAKEHRDEEVHHDDVTEQDDSCEVPN